jgi:hypothetical protein
MSNKTAPGKEPIKEEGKTMAEKTPKDPEAAKKIAVLEGKSPIDQIKDMIGKGVTAQDLKEFLAVQKDWESNEARKVFAAAFSRAQENIGKVLKTKINPQTHSKYADLGDVIVSAKPIYTKEGFSVIFYETDKVVEGTVRVNADVLHSGGHKESFHYDVPLDGVGLQGNANMTKIHGKSSSVSYGRRYLMCMIWNIPTADDDGNAAGVVKLIDDKQKSQILDGLVDLGYEPKHPEYKKFFELMNVEGIDKLPADKFKAAMALIQVTKASKKAKTVEAGK